MTRAPRLSSAQRGYGKEHVRLRKRAIIELEAAGHLPCVRCGEPIYAKSWEGRIPNGHVAGCASQTCDGTCWLLPELDHDDRTARQTWSGLAHAACNRAKLNGQRSKGQQKLITHSW